MAREGERVRPPRKPAWAATDYGLRHDSPFTRGRGLPPPLVRAMAKMEAREDPVEQTRWHWNTFVSGVRLFGWQWVEVVRIADRHGVSLQVVIREALTDWLQRQKRKPAGSRPWKG